MLLPIQIPIKGANVNISPFRQDSFEVLNGCNNTWKLGALMKDTGYAKFGASIQSGETINNLFHFRQNASTQKLLATVNDATDDDTQLFYKTHSGSWTEITDAETAWANYANMDVQMEGFIGYCFFVGYGAADGFLPVASLTGTTFSTATNVTSMPQAKFIKRYRNRLYVANVKYGGTEYPYRIVASSPVTAGAITWDTSGSPTSTAGGYLDVDFYLDVTGMETAWDRLIIFTEDNAYLYDQSQFKETWNYGCSSPKTIQKSGPYLIWANNDGAWMSTGGHPQNISGEVIDFFRNSTPSTWFSALVDEEYHIYMGTVTVDGVTYTNCVLTFNIPLSAWRWRELGDSMTSFVRYTNAGKQYLMMGGTQYVWQKGKYTDATILSDDDGKDIVANFTLPPIHLQDISNLKNVKELWAIADRAQGISLQCRVIDRNSIALTPFLPLGKLYEYINKFEVNAEKGVMLQIQGSEYSSNPYFSIYDLALDVEQYAKN